MSIPKSLGEATKEKLDLMTHRRVLKIPFTRICLWGKQKFAPRISLSICLPIGHGRAADRARNGEKTAILSSLPFPVHSWFGAHQSPGSLPWSSSWKRWAGEVSAHYGQRGQTEPDLASKPK